MLSNDKNGTKFQNNHFEQYVFKLFNELQANCIFLTVDKSIPFESKVQNDVKLGIVFETNYNTHTSISI